MTDRPVAYTTQAGVLVVQTRNRGRSYARVRLHVEHGGALVTDASLVDAQVARITGALCDAGPEGGLCACGASAPCPPDAQCSDASALCEKPLFPEQPAAAAILDAAGVALQNLRDTLLAKASASFSVAGADAHETAMGDLVADALLARYKEAGAQIALVQGSRLRAGLPSPYDSPALAEQHLQRDPTSKPIDLVFGDAYAALPGGDAAVVRKLTGSTLHLALEHAVAAPGPAFLQVAGIKLSYATSADAGSRLRSLALDDGTPIPNDATPFTVVLSDRISAGEDGYGMLSEEPAAATPSRDLLVDVLADYLHSKPTVSPPASFERILAVP
jgi:5'-nucleotidase